MHPDNSSFDDSRRLLAEVAWAAGTGKALRIRGGNSKPFPGRMVDGIDINTCTHRGVVSYDPTELVVTARAGTSVAELDALLAENGQMLPWEPPSFAGKATVGGMVATGLSGPRRPYAGAIRDFVLGCRIITGEAKHLRFGGEVMKNVAGYDVSRLIVGSFGCLGLVTEVSMKVLPKPRATRSLLLELPATEVPKKLRAWRDVGLPVTGASHLDSWLHVRVEGGNGLVANAVREIGGEDLEPAFWDELRDQQLPFFADRRPLWRISVPQTAPLTPLPGSVLLDWGGAQRWLKSDAPAAVIRADAEQLGGHATLFSQRADVEPFHPMPEAMLRLHQRIKRQLDPRGIFNPARMYAAL